jgi:hypothetical protein
MLVAFLAYFPTMKMNAKYYSEASFEAKQETSMKQATNNSPSCLIHAGCFLGLLSNPEDEREILLRIII